MAFIREHITGFYFTRCVHKPSVARVSVGLPRRSSKYVLRPPFHPLSFSQSLRTNSGSIDVHYQTAVPWKSSSECHASVQLQMESATTARINVSVV